MSVKKQLSLAFGMLALLVLVVSAMALRGAATANDRFVSHVHGAAERATLALTIRSHANRRAMAVRDMVLATSPAELDAAKSTATQAHEDLLGALKALNEAVGPQSNVPERDRTLVAAIDKVEAAYSPVALAIVKLAADGKHEEAMQKIHADCRPLLAALLAAAREYSSYSSEQARNAVQGAEAAYVTQRNWLIGLCVAATLAAIALGALITRNLLTALGAEPADLSEIAQRVADGDLSPVHGANESPAASVLASMGQMQGQLVTLIGQVRSSADSIATASAQISVGNNDLSGRTEKQAAALEETAASMEELNATVKQNADNARQADQLAKGASTVAIRGGEVVDQVVETMRAINDSSKKISDIIGVIDGIAFQTNILALNAAVEAARAGEQGRGFAVVASEVRNLAGRSAEAAKEIKTLIGASVERVEQGTALVDQAGTTMTEVVTSIKRVTDIMGEISAASIEQSTGVAQVGEAVTQMDQATQQNAALVEESAAAAESMNVQAKQLVQAVAIFKLDQRAEMPASAAQSPRANAVRPTSSVERRGPNRATNITRPKFGAAASAAARPADGRLVEPAAASKTGTDDWASF